MRAESFPWSELDVDAGDPGGEKGRSTENTRLPPCCTLAGFARETRAGEGFALESLPPGTILLVETRNSEYSLTVRGGQHDVLVQGGAFFPEQMEARLQGATAGGCLVKNGWIQVGLRVELRVGTQHIITSPVRAISVQNLPPLPDAGERCG